ncbi:MAG TPA: MFS transporter [Gemmatimonadales bacterium]|nr:MFS transporter [Gemmatimonadales bacterium]
MGSNHVRWTVVALLFAATTVNYIDRQVLGILAPTLTRELGWRETDYAAIVSWFSVAYGIGLLGVGRFLDRIGVRRGLASAVAVWSLAAMGHALARTVTGFSVARAFLGVGESGNFPASIKAVAEWFPKRERALATGIFNAGTNVGVVLAALLVPWITLALGWRWAFVATGTLDLVWLAVWLTMYRPPSEHPRLSRAELAWIRSDPAEPTGHVAWRSLLAHRQTWAFIVGKALTDPVWLFYLFWLPKFLDATFGVRLAGLAAPLVVIYVAADIGSVTGGWMSGALITRGRSVNRGRKTALLIAALCIVPTTLAPAAHSMWLAVGIVAVAAGAHQWWSANLFTTASDMFPRRAVASVVGLGGFAGMASAFAFQRFTGALLEATGGSYAPIFAVLGLAYVLALALLHLLAPRLEPVA